MPTHLDRTAPPHAPPVEPRPHAPDDTAPEDLGDLWVDLGGGG